MLINSHNYNSILSNQIPDINNNSFTSKSKKEFDYYIRNYFEYQSCVKNGGQVCFLTLSFNDNALKHFVGLPVVDYFDFRWLIRDSGLRSWCAERNISFKYFCTCEYGEGKGVRGVDNNPHFHVIFYIYPIVKNTKKISIQDFADRICYYWQGPQYAKLNLNKKFAKLYKYGIVSASNKFGLELISPSAIRYVCKYVTKDNVIVKQRTRLMANAYHRTMYKVLQNRELVNAILFNKFNDFQKDVVDSYRQVFNLQVNEIFFDDISKCKRLYYENLYKYVSSIHDKDYIKKHISHYVDEYLKNEIKPVIYNRFTPKVRISQGIGLSALDDPSFDEDTGKIKVALKDKFGYYKLPLYLYRYKYCNKIKVKHRSKDSSYYVYKLNDKGINLKLNSIDDLLDLRKKKVYQYFNLYFNDKSNPFYLTKLSHSAFTQKQIIDSIIKFNFNDFVEKFVLYDSLFYRYKYNLHDDVTSSAFDYKAEFYKLLESDVYDYYYLSDFDLDKLYEVKEYNRNFISYKNHPYFNKYKRYYDVFQECLFMFDNYIDDFKDNEANKKRNSKRVLNRVFQIY